MFPFVYFELNVSTTKDDAISPAIGKKVMEQCSKLTFFSQFDIASIERRDSETLSFETKNGTNITLHPNGSFHIMIIPANIELLSTLERWTSKIASAFKTLGPKRLEFDVILETHTDIKQKGQSAAISRIFTGLRTNSPLIHTQKILRPTFFVAEIPPLPTTRSMHIMYHREYVNLYFSLKPLAPARMKNRFLIAPTESLISVVSSELGDN